VSLRCQLLSSWVVLLGWGSDASNVLSIEELPSLFFQQV